MSNQEPQLLQDRQLVPNSGSAVHSSKINTQETSNGGKGKIVLFTESGTWEDGGLMPQRQSSQSRGSRGFLRGRPGPQWGLSESEAGSHDFEHTCLHQWQLFF